MHSLRNGLKDDRTMITGWCGIGDSLYLTAVARTGFDAMTLDMQHGMQTDDSVIRGTAAIVAAGKPVIVRIPVGRFDFASRALDFGASAVIAPMINNIEDARAFAGFMKYPPLGERSYGPTQAVQVLAMDNANAYVTEANSATMAIAMIETVEAIGNLDAILAVDGIDAVLTGPSDLSLSVRQNPVAKPFGEETIGMLADVATRARKAGKIAATFCYTPDLVIRAHAMGYRLIALGSDGAYVSQGADRLLDELPFRTG